MVSGERIRQARELRGLTQTELANRIDANQSTVARIEIDELQPSDEALEAIAIQTGFPPAFFRREPKPGFPAGSLQFRARKMSAGERTRVYQYARTVWESVQDMADEISEIPVKLPSLNESPEIAADVARSELGLPPDTPIPHLINALEKAGVIVLTVPLPLKKWDAFCTWTGEERTRPVIVIASEAPGDRLRYSVAHETGHLVLHRSLQGELKGIDQEANRFAAALLMPKSAMLQEIVPPVTLTSLAELKPRWGVSIQALIYRARDLGIITDRQFRYLFEQLSRRGWRKQEPLTIPVERPRAVRKMAEILYGLPIDHRQFAAKAGFRPQFAKDILELHASREEMLTGRKNQEATEGKLVKFTNRQERSG